MTFQTDRLILHTKHSKRFTMTELSILFSDNSEDRLELDDNDVYGIFVKFNEDGKRELKVKSKDGNAKKLILDQKQMVNQFISELKILTSEAESYRTMETWIYDGDTKKFYSNVFEPKDRSKKQLVTNILWAIFKDAHQLQEKSPPDYLELTGYLGLRLGHLTVCKN